MGIFQELRERRLVQIALTYAVGAWLVLQVADQLADRGIVPELVYRIVLIWAVLGVPASLLIGWHHGEKGRQKAPLSEIAALIVLAFVALGFSASSVSHERQLDAQRASAENPLQARDIAVLYFSDETADGEYQYLADALTEDLITELSQVNGLRVVSRNGALQFRGADVRPDSVARVLRAGTVVDGTIERRARRLRLNLRISSGITGEHLGSVAIDLDPEEALTTRDSVTAHAARLLRVALGEEVRVRQATSGTRNTAAWALAQRAEKARKDAEAAAREGDTDRATELFDAADSMLAEASGMAPEWSDPPTSRAWLAYRRARLAQANPAESARHVETALAHVDEAFRRSSTNARAFEARGTLTYWKVLGLKAAPDARTEEAWVRSAISDLETAVRFDPLLASAHGSLAFIYAASNDATGAVLAAQKAYEADMFLENAPLILRRLFQGSLDLETFPRARTWCDEGVRRFPNDYLTVACQLRLMVTPAVDRPDIDSAWAIARRVEELAPPARKERQRVQNEMTVAGAIARAGSILNQPRLGDSAQAVLMRASAAATPDIDPTRELLGIAAYSWLLLGDREQAVRLLEQHAAADPQRYTGGQEARSWWWRDLEGHPRFRSIVGLD
jgi:TolB-like protein